MQSPMICLPKKSPQLPIVFNIAMHVALKEQDIGLPCPSFGLAFFPRLDQNLV